MGTIEVAVVSSTSRFCDIDANLEHFDTLTRKAAQHKARLVCFPELALTSYTTERSILDVAERVPGPVTEKIGRMAASHGVYLSVGLAERAGGQYYIAQVVVGPSGYVGKYRKHHPTSGEQACGFSPGKSFPTFAIDGFKLGINICADGRQTDTIDAMRRARVDIIHHPHGNGLGLGRESDEWTRGKLAYFVPRAIRARSYILIHNSAGDTKHPNGVMQFGSGAVIIDPLGQAVARTTQKTRAEKTIYATLVKPLSALIPDFEMERLRAPR